MASFPGVVVESASVALGTLEMRVSTAYAWGHYYRIPQTTIVPPP